MTMTVALPAITKKQLLGSEISHAGLQTVREHIMAWAQARQSAYVCIANVHMVVEALLNPAFQLVLNQADLATPDGKPLSVLMNTLYGTHQHRIAGPDLMLDVLADAVQQGIGVYFYGATEETLVQLKAKLSQEYPALRLAGMTCPPFRPLTPAEDETIVNDINYSGAGVIFVALGCPKQERWMAEHKGRIHGVMIGVGAAFNFYTGQIGRAPQWMQDNCLEWLYRLYKEPTRLFKRYLITNSIFMVVALKQLVQVKLKAVFQ